MWAKRLTAATLVAGLAGCSTTPLTQPTALVAPHPEISDERFELDEFVCKVKASEASVEKIEKSLHLDHIGIGSAIGGLIGLAVPGGSSFTALAGVIGGGLAGLKETLTGYRGAFREKELAALNAEYQRCMFKRGHIIPGLPIHPGAHVARERRDDRQHSPRHNNMADKE